MNSVKESGGRNAAPGIRKNYTMVIALVAVFVLFALLTDGRLLYPQNLSNLLIQNAYVLVLGCGMLLCILTGGNVDLSVGATVCLSGAVAAQLLAAGFGAFPAVVIAVLVAAAIGLLQGFLIGYVKMPPFICTLAGMFLIRGLARIVLESKTVVISNEDFFSAFRGYINIPGIDDGGIKWSSVIFGIVLAAAYTAVSLTSRYRKKNRGILLSADAGFGIRIFAVDAVLVLYFLAISYYQGVSAMLLWVIGVIVIFAFITSKTVFGRYLYAVGGNENATRLSGVNTNKVYFLAYLLSSLMAGIAGMLVASRIGSVNGDVGTGYEMDAIAACFIGGASAYGGSGTVPGVIVGAVLMGILNQGMSIYGIDSNVQFVVKGAVLLLAVLMDVLAGRRAGKVWPHKLPVKSEVK